MEPIIVTELSFSEVAKRFGIPHSKISRQQHRFDLATEDGRTYPKIVMNEKAYEQIEILKSRLKPGRKTSENI